MIRTFLWISLFFAGLKAEAMLTPEQESQLDKNLSTINQLPRDHGPEGLQKLTAKAAKAIQSQKYEIQRLRRQVGEALKHKNQPGAMHRDEKEYQRTLSRIKDLNHQLLGITEKDVKKESISSLTGWTYLPFIESFVSSMWHDVTDMHKALGPVTPEQNQAYYHLMEQLNQELQVDTADPWKMAATLREMSKVLLHHT